MEVIKLRTEYIKLDTPEALYDAIYQLKVRGAPAIGICAGYGLYVLAKKLEYSSEDDFLGKLSQKKKN